MKRLLPWLVGLALLFVVFCSMYAVTQQGQRSDANYPQIQIATDTAAALDNGDTPVALVNGNVNLKSSLAPFTLIYDKKGNPVMSSGILNNKVPKAPLGILTAAKDNDYHTVTWEPQKGVRIAAVTVAAKDYYVLSGRSLKEVEKNEAKTLQLALIGCIVSLMLFGLIFVLKAVDPQYPI